MQLVTRPEPWVVGEFTGKATHGLGNRRRAFWHVLQNRIRLRGGVKGPAGVEDALVVGDEDVDAVDVAAAGRDALGQLGDDAHGVLAVSIRPRSVEAAAAAPLTCSPANPTAHRNPCWYSSLIINQLDART